MPSKNSIQVVCVAEFFAKDGKAGELIDALHVLIKPTHAEDGCIRYELNQRADQQNGITFIEKWKDKKAFDEHCAKPYISDFFNNVRPGLVDRFEVKLYEEILP
jgi:quinol monooxygenase YgiN